MTAKEQIAVLNRASEAGYFDANISKTTTVRSLAEAVLGEALHHDTTWELGGKPWNPKFLSRWEAIADAVTYLR